MRIVALEEHFSIPEIIRRIGSDAIAKRGFPIGRWKGPDRQLADLGAERLGDMDQAGITVQVLSASGPGADLVDGAEGVSVARDMNDVLARAIAEHPERFAGFAHLPMRSPQAAADELERAVGELGFRGAMINGMTQDCFLDDARFDVILSRAERLGVPIYLHPNLPPESVRKAYYDDLPGITGFLLSAPAWGWHSELAIHVLRLVLSGTLDRHPGLKLIVGHMGEGLPAMLARCDQMFGGEIGHLTRSISTTILDQVSITTSGLFTLPPFELALAVFGIDRILFSIDYPYSSNRQGMEFLQALRLAPADLDKLAHGNADRLLRLSPARREGRE
jgi:predicted TIM-barrel fold metal-dependent hydrolase